MDSLQPGEAGAIAHQRAATYISRFDTTGEGSFKVVKDLKEVIEQHRVRVKEGDDPALSYGQLAQEIDQLLPPQA